MPKIREKTVICRISINECVLVFLDVCLCKFQWKIFFYNDIQMKILI